MRTIDNARYLTADEYDQAIKTMKGFSTLAISWARTENEGNLRTEIIGNFIARGTVLLDSVRTLWAVGNYQDCWILHRALIDRVIHILDLIDQDAFEEFERWSFQRRYQMTDVALSDPTITVKLTESALKEAKAIHSERGKRFRAEPPSGWKRPRAKEVAKRRNLPILDRIGYDVASTSVHPMADDGKHEFHALLKIPTEQYGDPRTVLHNSLVVQYLLVERGISGCDLLWRNLVNDFLTNWLSFVETSNIENLQACIRILTLAACDPDLPWCENKPTLARGDPNHGLTH